MDLIAAAGWTPQDFKDAMGGGFKIERMRACGGDAAAGYIGPTNTIRFYNGTFSSGVAFAKFTIVHEIAHRWDAASSHGGQNERLSRGMMAETGGMESCPPPQAEMYGCYYEGDAANGPLEDRYRDDEYWRTSRKEGWAESVAAFVYPDFDRGGATNIIQTSEAPYAGITYKVNFVGMLPSLAPPAVDRGNSSTEMA